MIPKIISESIKKDEFDKLILFILAVNGSYNLDELLKEAVNLTKKKLGVNTFSKWILVLIKDQFIEKFTRYDENFYQITT